MKLKLIAAEKSTAASPLVKKFAEEMGGGSGSTSGAEGETSTDSKAKKQNAKSSKSDSALVEEEEKLLDELAQTHDENAVDDGIDAKTPKLGGKLAPNVVAELKKSFALSEYPALEQRQEIAARLGMQQLQVNRDGLSLLRDDKYPTLLRDLQNIF